MRTRWTAAAVLIAGLAACSTDGDGDAGGMLACRNFRSTANDYDTLNASELRSRLRGIDDNAKISDNPSIRTAGRALIVADTSGTTNDMIDAVNAMTSACAAAGH